MQSVILKYEVPEHGFKQLSLTVGSMIVDCAIQGSRVFVWTIEDADIKETYTDLYCQDVFILKTNCRIDTTELHGFLHLKTVHGGNFVWHVFARKEFVA